MKRRRKRNNNNIKKKKEEEEEEKGEKGEKEEEEKEKEKRRRTKPYVKTSTLVSSLSVSSLTPISNCLLNFIAWVSSQCLTLYRSKTESLLGLPDLLFIQSPPSQ